MMTLHARIRLPIARRSPALALAVALTAASTGCLASLPRRTELSPQPRFDPTRFFAGRTHGEGKLDVRIGSDRNVTVEGRGRTEPDGTFRLEQDITYGDGSVDRRVWLLRRTDSTHFAGALSDASGDVTADVRGNRFHLRYLIRHPAVYMEQWLYLQADGRTVQNLAQVTVLGIPWARLSETITRTEGTNATGGLQEPREHTRPD